MPRIPTRIFGSATSTPTEPVQASLLGFDHALLGSLGAAARGGAQRRRAAAARGGAQRRVAYKGLATKTPSFST